MFFLKGIIVLWTTITLPISGLFTHAKPVAKHTLTITASPTITKAPSATPTVIPTKAKVTIQQPVFVFPTNTPVPTVIIMQTYSILSLGQLVTMNGATEPAIEAAQSAYNIFLQTQNLQYMTPSQQQQLFAPLLNTAIQNSVAQQKAHLQDELNNLNQPTPTPQQNNNQQDQALQTCIANKTASINNNPYYSESSRLTHLAHVYDDCLNGK